MQTSGDADRTRDHGGREQRIVPPDQQHHEHHDHGDVEQHRRERSQHETMFGIQHAHHHNGWADESEIRHHQPGVIDSELQCLAADKAGCKHCNDERHQQREDDRDADQDEADAAEHASREGGCRNSAFGFPHPQIMRDQRSVQRAFGERAARHIDELERHQKRVRDRAGTKQRRDQRVAHEPQRPRRQRAGRDGQDMTDHRTILRITCLLAGALS